MHLVESSQLVSGLVLASDLVYSNGDVIKSNTILDSKEIEEIQGKFKRCCVYSLVDLQPKILQDTKFCEDYASFLVRDFRHLISAILYKRKTEEIVNLLDYIAKDLSNNRQALTSLIKLRQNHRYTYEHSTNVALLCLELGLTLDLYDEELHSLVIGAILHDLGKLYISNQILDKAGTLTEKEFKVVREHPNISAILIQNLQGLQIDTIRVVSEHHEKLDGSGYPNKLRGEEIHPLSRIVTTCDMYDAITSNRSYHEAKPLEVCRGILLSDAKKGKLDTKIVNTLFNQLARYPRDTFIRLSNGASGFVVDEDPVTNRPVIYDSTLDKLYDLKSMPSVDIVYAS